MQSLASISVGFAVLFVAACGSHPTPPRLESAAPSSPLTVPSPTVRATSAKCSAPEYRQFDFWLGEWDVFEAEDKTKPIARAHVSAMADGCAIREVYEQFDGLVGESFNIYDGTRKAWHESWVTNRGQLLLLDGSLEGGAMKLNGMSDSADGTNRKVHHIWSIEADGGVREAAEGSTDDGKTWKGLFDVVFRRRVG
jgi:hypothetical protein